MSRRLGLVDCGVLDARQWPSACASLLGAGAPRLAVARLSGAVAAVGRWQRSSSVLTAQALEKAPVRRVTGGRAAALGEGQVAIALVLPHRSWLVSDEPDALPASRLINRSVRGVLAGLGSIGVSANYFGRDYVSVQSAQAGLVGFEIAASGAALVECVLAAESHWWLPAQVDALPPRPPVRGVPGPGHVPALAGRSSTELLEVMARGYATTFGVELSPETFAFEPLALEDPADLPRRSALHPVPAGFVEAQARTEEDRVVECRFHGDFNADSAGLFAMQEAVVGARPSLEELAPRMNDVYRDAAHTILGVEDLEVFATVLVEACAS